MSVASAVAFVRLVRRDDALRASLAAAPPRLEALCAVAATRGLFFAPSDIEQAFWIEWMARWVHFSRETLREDDAGHPAAPNSRKSL
jgi:hypothetical protein